MDVKQYRVMFKFWLDVTKEGESELAALINELKEARLFSRFIRDGLRLMASLWQRDLSVLLELFPWVQEAIQNAQEGGKSGQGGGGGQIDPAAIDAITDRLLERSNGLMMAPSTLDTLANKIAAQIGSAPAASTPRASLPAPAAYDDFDTIEVKAAAPDPEAGKRATQNFIRSMLALQDIGKPAPVIAGNPKQIAGSNVAFAAPNFDDDIGIEL